MPELRRLPLGLLALALLVALALAGCGKSGGGASAPSGTGSTRPDPATLAPRDSALYAELLVRPSGDVAAGIEAAARKLLRVQDAGREVRRLVDRTLANQASGKQTYARDVEPWLGDRLGIFVLIPADGKGTPDVAVAIAARDRAALASELEHQRSSGDLHKGATYHGVAYDLDAKDGTPNALVGDFLVVAQTMRAFHAAVDASKGSSLADSTRYKGAIASIDPDRLAFAYTDPQAIARQLRGIGGVGAKLRRFLDSPRIAKADPITVALTARANRVVLEATVGSGLIGTTDSSGDTVSVGELPGDAWLAAATPPLGPLLRSVLVGAGVHDAAAAQVRQAVGLDLDRDVLDPLGGLGLFVRGTSPLDIGAGVTLRMHDAASAQRLLTRVQAIATAASGGAVHSLAGGFELTIPQSPQPIVVLARGDRIAVGYAASSARDLLKPQRRFDQSSAGKAAIATLGDGFTPSLVLIAPPLVQLLAALDQIEVANLSPALPYLRAYRSLAIGTKRDGARTTVRIVAALR